MPTLPENLEEENKENPPQDKTYDNNLNINPTDENNQPGMQSPSRMSKPPIPKKNHGGDSSLNKNDIIEQLKKNHEEIQKINFDKLVENKTNTPKKLKKFNRTGSG